VNEEMARAAGAPGGPGVQQELADCLSILKDVDRHLTQEHVSARFQELLEYVGWNTTPGSRDSLDATAGDLYVTLSGKTTDIPLPRKRRTRRPGPRTAVLTGTVTAVMLLLAALLIGPPSYEFAFSRQMQDFKRQNAWAILLLQSDPGGSLWGIIEELRDYKRIIS
jgi:hypothetical protein